MIVTPSDPKLSFRPITPADREFLIQVYKSVRQEELDRVIMWNEEEKMAFLIQQFDAQHTHYQRYFSKADFCIIEYKNKPIGRLYLLETEEALHIVEISILPLWRNKKLGSSIFNDIMTKASKFGKAVSIHVEKFNPALRLYERLGFKLVHEVNDVYIKMQWKE